MLAAARPARASTTGDAPKAGAVVDTAASIDNQAFVDVDTVPLAKVARTGSPQARRFALLLGWVGGACCRYEQRRRRSRPPGRGRLPPNACDVINVTGRASLFVDQVAT